ncbi:zinc-ribbon domain-containing protein [Lacrimispora sphenoides]|uniref:zinc-ribbon domain-containing protein n=1 Tax=Lacrimispora sphenoides TaxID=29370 RepID=UPI0008C9ED74|nr:zinc-ribbon domain-containing protein [Lacrimispora sphenoides]SEU08142.1 zinc-ribbon domain-containing protein [Lacrimispora sphenoides]
MLIKCPECGKDISDKSQSCIHCGYPLNESIVHQNTCIINGTSYDLTEELNDLTNDLLVVAIKKIRQKSLISLGDANNLCKIIRETKQVPPTFNSTSEVVQQNVPRCPYCSSTDLKKISGFSKAGSVALFGIFSVGKVSKQWHCNSCKSDF